MEVLWLEDALTDVRDIYHHIAADNPEAAAQAVRRIQAAGNALATLSERGRPGRWPGTRELVIVGTPYLLPYRAAGSTIQILRVLHGRRAWPKTP